MKVIKLAIIGAAVAAGITLLLNKNEDGESILDELTENSPELLNKAKEFAGQTFDKFISDFKS